MWHLPQAVPDNVCNIGLDMITHCHYISYLKLAMAKLRWPGFCVSRSVGFLVAGGHHSRRPA
jgi:hypothetical protein